MFLDTSPIVRYAIHETARRGLSIPVKNTYTSDCRIYAAAFHPIIADPYKGMLIEYEYAVADLAKL